MSLDGLSVGLISGLMRPCACRWERQAATRAEATHWVKMRGPGETKMPAWHPDPSLLVMSLSSSPVRRFIWPCSTHAAASERVVLATGGQGHADVAITCLAPLDEGHISPSAAASAGERQKQQQHPRQGVSPFTRALDAVAQSAKGVCAICYAKSLMVCLQPTLYYLL